MKQQMAVFEHIPHHDRVIYERTFMNEISLLFTYNPIKLEIASEVIARVIQEKNININIISNDVSNNSITLKDQNALISFTSNALLVSLPTREYTNFIKTDFLWNDVEVLLKELEVSPIVWSFTKGNRWIFNKSISLDQEREVFKIVLSEDLLNSTPEKNIYVEESTDKSCVFTCRYGLEKVNEKDSIGMKTMIASQSYSVDNLCEQVFAVNELMFDVWYWCVSDSIKELMKTKQ